MKMVMDADSFVYSTAAKMLRDNPFLEGDKVSNWTEVRESFIKKVQFLKERLELSDLVMYISGQNNFRYTVDIDYKATRKGTEAPMHLGDLKQYAVEYMGAIRADGAEADDYTISHKLLDPSVMIAAIDKDVCNSVAGRHYNYWKEEFVEVSEQTAIQWPFIQTLMGDAGDNILGLKGVGIKTAQKLLGDETRPEKLWKIITNAYILKDRTVEDALMTMRLVRMDQFNHKTKKLKLWEPIF